MSGAELERLNAPERVALRRIRRELGVGRQRNPCPVCGDERWDDAGPVARCETCGGQRVRAANLLRAIIGHARAGLGHDRRAGLGHDWLDERRTEARR